MRNLILFILPLITVPLIACDCAPIKSIHRALEYESTFVDDVFVGDVKCINNDSTTYEIIVCEVFKGDLRPGQKIKGINEGLCGPFVFRTGEWILLGTYSNEFNVHDCGLTTDLDKPWTILPPPPPPNTEKELEQDWLDKWKVKSRKEAYRQIEILRNKKPGQNNK